MIDTSYKELFLMSIGSRLQHLRHEYHFSIDSVAEFLDITPSLLNEIEQNQRTLTVSQLEHLCDLYGIEEDHILKNKSISSIKFNNKEKLDVNTIYQMNKLIRNLEFISYLTDFKK